MKRKCVKSVRFELILDEDEAKWLRELVQNPIFDDETTFDSEMRKDFFNALKE